MFIVPSSIILPFFFFSSRRRHTRWPRDWSPDVCSSDLNVWRPTGTRRSVEVPMDSTLRRLALVTLTCLGLLAGAHSPLASSHGLLAVAQGEAQEKVIKIGALFAFTGPGSYFGVQDKQAIDLAVEQLNRTGVDGYRFQVF